MNIEQIYTGCLAQGAYYIESKGEVAIIDPLREVQPYLDRAKRDNAKITHIFETHFHADFVSGHVTLSKETGAVIVYGPNGHTTFDAVIASDGQEFTIGELTIKVLHTPGHTMESTTYLLKDAAGKDYAIFSGDTLFLGDVGRPDLAQKAVDMTKEDLAGILFDSLRKKIMPLADDIIVYPAHGAGSACGKNMMAETIDTLGNQKKTNYALRADMTKKEFIKEVTDGLSAPPKYFPLNVQMNKEGYDDIADVLNRGANALSPKAFETTANETAALILDVRHQKEFISGHIPRSIFIGLNGDFAPWVGTLVADTKQPILLVTPQGLEEETIMRLSRVGFDGTIGYLEGSFDAWKSSGRDYDTITSLAAEEVKENINSKKISVFDVRKVGEYQSEHVVQAIHTPLSMLNEYLEAFPKESTFYLHCAGGYRSIIAASIIKSRGIHNLVDLAGGYNALKAAGVEVTNHVQPTGV